MQDQPEHLRGHLAALYAERRRHREEAAELVHHLDLSRQREQLLAQKAIALAGMALLEREEGKRLQALVDNLRARLAEATKTAPCQCGGDEGRPEPAS